jgi:hypothetical protein
MKPLLEEESDMKKYLGVAAGMMAAVALALAASPAMARTNVDINIGFPGVVYAESEPVYVQPRPVYVQPQRVYVTPQPVYVERNYGHRGHHGHHWRGGDQDRDGVPNRFDRDRDGDGVPNRWDRRPQNPYRY